MKIVVLRKSDLSVVGTYEADGPRQHEYGGLWGDRELTVHVAMQSGIDYRACEFTHGEDGTIEVTEDSTLKTTIAQQDAVVAAQAAVSKAISFGQQLITEFAAENIVLGITQDGQTGVVLDKMSSVMTALQSGSLYEAMNRAKAIPQSDYDNKYITYARIMSFVNKIEAYLGLPLSL
jgi:hypothetical protein